MLDDIIVWWIADDVFDVMPNASNTARVLDAVGGDDVTATRAILAVQGPQARARVGQIFPEAAAVPRFRVQQLSWQGQPVTVAGTGYTGEDGIEISVPAGPPARCGTPWSAPASSRPGSAPATRCGSKPACRCTATSSAPASRRWRPASVGSWRGTRSSAGRSPSAPFVGRDRAATAGWQPRGRRPPRADCAVSADGVEVGIVTSGNYSPVLEHGIALAFLTTSIEDGQVVEIDVRGTSLPAVVVPTPFVTKR